MDRDERARRERERNRCRLRTKRATDAAFNERQTAGKRARRKNPRVRASEKARSVVRRARLIAAGREMPARDNAELNLLAAWILIIERDPCSYCQKRAGRMQVDHIEALIRSRDWRLTNSAPACEGCNPSKGDRPWWLAFQRLSPPLEPPHQVCKSKRRRTAKWLGRDDAAC